jgi:hypothetical protein
MVVPSEERGMRYRIKEVIRQQKKSGLEVESSFFWRPNRGSIAVIDNHSEDRFGSGNVVSRTVQLLPDYPRYRKYCSVVPTDAKGARAEADDGVAIGRNALIEARKPRKN